MTIKKIRQQIYKLNNKARVPSMVQIDSQSYFRLQSVQFNKKTAKSLSNNKSTTSIGILFKMMMPISPQICRCCLVEHPTISYKIFERENLSKDLMECVPSLKIAINDGLPDLICDLCWLRLRETVDFKRKCEESDKELRERYKEMNSGNDETVHSAANLESCLPLAVLEKTNFTNVEALLCSSTMLPCELTAEEVAILNDLVFEDSNRQANVVTERDPAVTELFEMVLNDVGIESNTTLNNSTSKENSNQSSIVSSTTPASRRRRTKTRNSKKIDHTCLECGKKFTRNFQLTLHLSSVHKIGAELQYQCTVCQKMFASLHSLKYHRKSVHTEERAYVCGHCDRRFVLRSQLASHERIHSGKSKPRIHECQECGKVWPTKSALRTHLRVHDSNVDRRFKCDQCDKRFLTRGHLAAHTLVHTGEKPFGCTICNKSYQCVGNLNNHMVKCHSAFRSRHRHCDRKPVTES